MPRGRTAKGRARTAFVQADTSSRPLLKTTDHGDAIPVRARHVAASGDRWVEPFLSANLPSLRRLALSPEVDARPELHVKLTPGPRIGAIPLLSPSTRKVVAGLLVEPRFRWHALGSVFDAIGFSVEPTLGGAPLVPGSAREVPPWLLAGPVVQRIASLLRHRRRGFVERQEIRQSPRGRIEWTTWAAAQVPRGAWTSLPCCFTEPADDPDLIAAVRWTLKRVEEDLGTLAWSPTTRRLLRQTAELITVVGSGPMRRPLPSWTVPAGSEWVAAAIEAMTWVAEERGLGGAKILDGLAWDLSIDEVWEAWVNAFSAELARLLGLVPSPFRSARRPLHWQGPVHSMGALVPDVELRTADRVVWIDAKYKAHFEELSRHGWYGLSDDLRDRHRADLHQALAYASLADVSMVDSVLVYPDLRPETRIRATVATVTSGRRRVRLVLLALPFGFRSPQQKEGCLRSIREVLAA